MLPIGRSIFFLGHVVLQPLLSGRRELLATDLGSGFLCVYGRETDVDSKVTMHINRMDKLAYTLAAAGLASLAAAYARRTGVRRGV